MRIKFISIGGYSPEMRVFVTLIKSTKVVRLVIAKHFDHAPKTILYLEI